MIRYDVRALDAAHACWSHAETRQHGASHAAGVPFHLAVAARLADLLDLPHARVEIAA